MTVWDNLALADADDECRAWIRKMIVSQDEILAFVAARRGGSQAGEYVGYQKGSFNFGLRFRFNDGGSDAFIRFAKPGQTATVLRDEKVTNEVQVMEFLRQNTTIPLPRVSSWGLTAESPLQLGPFIIMEYVDGTRLSTLLKQPPKSENDDAVLNPDIDDAKLDFVFEQIVGYNMQLSRFNFTSIGAISENPISKTWNVSGRPLTYDMNELATGVSKYPLSEFPSAPFTSTKAYLNYLADDHLTHLCTQRNLADSAEEARKQYIARHQFKRLIPEYCIEEDDGSFKLFCDDLQPSNMLANPETFEITAVLDWEYTNTMPAQFTYDPPWWLLLLGPELWIDRDKLTEFMDLYPRRMDQFLRAVERVEARLGSTDTPSLSARMRASWDSGRFWFDLGIRKSIDVDNIYWDVLHERHGGGADSLDDKTRAEMELFVQMKMDQLKIYKTEYTIRFPSKDNE